MRLAGPKFSSGNHRETFTARLTAVPGREKGEARVDGSTGRWLTLPAICLVSFACSASDTSNNSDIPSVLPGAQAGPAVPGVSPPATGPLEPESSEGLIEPDAEEPPPPPPVAEPPPPPVPMGGLGGTAWMPANSPDQVEPARAMPASAALVQLSKEPAAAYPEAAYCNVCVEPAAYFTTTDTKGLFMLEDVPEGTYFLTVEKGQFRRQTEVTIVADQVAAAETQATTLPSNHAPENGDFTPRIAMVIGQYDQAQFVLGKLGIGEEDDVGVWAPGTAVNRVDVFQGDYAAAQPDQAGTLTDLVGNLEQLKQYHVVLIPCGPAGVPTWMLEPQNLENLRAYVAAGGGLFVTGWAGTYIDVLFPAQLEFLGGDTPAMAYDAAANTWNTDLFGAVNDVQKTLVQEPRSVDADLSAWLLGQEALGPRNVGAEGEHQEIVDPNIWGGFMDAQIVHANEVTIGLDAAGMPVVDKPRILVDAPTQGGERAPVGVLFRPAGCGRVMYSSYELDGAGRAGSTPVERILMYSLMELSVCDVAEPPEVEDPPPPSEPVPVPLPK